MRRLGLASVIDLRADHEIALAGRHCEPGVNYHHVPFGDLLATEEHWDAWADPTYVAERYFELCLAAGESIAEAFAILTDAATYPVVIHCSLGKDRTGVLVALLLRSIGVSVGAIMVEHERSMVGASRLVARLRDQMGAEQHDLDPYVPALLAADPESIRRFLRLLHDEFGSVRRYLGSLGVGSAVDHVRAALVE
jgi:protein-tyrosine phosphatase